MPKKWNYSQMQDIETCIIYTLFSELMSMFVLFSPRIYRADFLAMRISRSTVRTDLRTVP